VADDVVLVDPVFHVGADDVVALLFEQERGDGAVDAAGHGDEDLFTGGHAQNRRVAVRDVNGADLSGG
jgi:hypothetical protein